MRIKSKPKQASPSRPDVWRWNVDSVWHHFSWMCQASYLAGKSTNTFDRYHHASACLYFGIGAIEAFLNKKIRERFAGAKSEEDLLIQMEWYVTLATTTNFGIMPEWEQRKWREEFAAMKLRGMAPVLPVPADTKRYPRGEDNKPVLRTFLPNLTGIQEVRDGIARHLNELADGKGTFLGPFQTSLTVSFHHIHDAYGRQEIPRHIIYRGEIGEEAVIGHPRSLLIHMTKLLEIYCDQIRRCPHCHAIFLQFRRQQEYCGRRCQSVAVMQKRRNEDKAQKRKPTEEKSHTKGSIKGRLRHGKKRR